MKFLLFILIASLSHIASGQSYVILDNGVTVTTDTSGFAYDFGHYSFPQKVTLKGGQYFVEEGGILATIDENGLLFRKYELIPEVILGKGINYFLSSEGFLYGIDKKGSVHVTESEQYTEAQNFGGNYFVVTPQSDSGDSDLYVVTDNGTPVKASLEDFKVKDVVSFGGNYLMTNSGTILTMSSNGIVTPQENYRVGVLMKKGGNFFTDYSGTFFSVAQNGELKLPNLPTNLKVSSILKLGSNYFIDQYGKFYVVDKNGDVFERVVRDQDFKLAKIISL